jgi:hypothetical protein
MTNSNIEIRNSKQVQMIKKQKNSKLAHPSLGFGLEHLVCFELCSSDFGF